MKLWFEGEGKNFPRNYYPPEIRCFGISKKAIRVAKGIPCSRLGWGPLPAYQVGGLGANTSEQSPWAALCMLWDLGGLHSWLYRGVCGMAQVKVSGYLRIHAEVKNYY